MSKWGKRRGSARFLQLHHRLLKSHAWHCLTPLQRCGYIEIAQLYDGTNNGRLAMSARRLAGLIPCSKNSPVLGELEDAGFIETVRRGKYTRKAEDRTASEYRLTDFKCDVTGELPSRKYNERHRWNPRELPPKRKPLTGAERARRHRKRNAERPNEWDGSVPTTGTDFVTRPKAAEATPRKTAKNGAQEGDDVTLSVPLTGTLIHLTRGGGYLGHPQPIPTGSKLGGPAAWARAVQAPYQQLTPGWLALVQERTACRHGCGGCCSPCR
jgi:hypothetical protein